jgi:hypothetical protein
MIVSAGPNSATLTGKGNKVVKMNDWLLLPMGRLKDLLTVEYRTIDEFILACASKGIMVSIVGPKGTQAPYWSVDKTPVLTISAEPDVPWMVRIAASYSAAE